MELFRRQKEMNNWTDPTVKHAWNIAMHVLDIFFFLSKTQQLTTRADRALISFS